MNLKEEQFQLIEDYLAGVLSQTEHKAIISRMQHDPAFKKEVELHREIRNALTDQREIKLETQLDSLGKKYFASPSPMRRLFGLGQRTYLVAAVVSLLILSVAGWLLMQSTAVEGGQELFTEYYEAYPGRVTVRSDLGSAFDDSLFNAAFRAYENQNYDSALASFHIITQYNPSAAYASFYAGICYLEMGLDEEAIETFQVLSYKPRHLFVQQAKWYLALALIRGQQIRMAKTQLKSLRDTGGKYGKKAAKLLAEFK